MSNFKNKNTSTHKLNTIKIKHKAFKGAEFDTFKK